MTPISETHGHHLTPSPSVFASNPARWRTVEVDRRRHSVTRPERLEKHGTYMNALNGIRSTVPVM